MSSDEAYSSFLERANQDTGTSSTSTKTSSAATKTVDTDVPAPLQTIEQYYVSEADEPFVPVSLKWTGRSMPSEYEFKDLVGHDGEVSTMSTQEFDPKGDYKEVIEAVQTSGDGKARIFRLHQGRAKAQYYIVGFDEKGKRIVGLKANAVES
ncbi:hypothetical protein MMC06_002579 [Schaereria dolodes]|nr:hypothetical protein [Schaereria dolodes]